MNNIDETERIMAAERELRAPKDRPESVTAIVVISAKDRDDMVETLSRVPPAGRPTVGVIGYEEDEVAWAIGLLEEKGYRVEPYVGLPEACETARAPDGTDES